MKSLSLCAFLVISIILRAQTLPTNGLKVQYDMLTLNSSNLKDLSGNGNDGTINGTTTNAQGRVFNGTSDNISVPLVLSNSDFTVLAVYQPPSGGSYSPAGALWSESDGTSNCGAANCVRFSAGGGTTLVGSGGSVGFINSAPLYRNPDFDVWYFQRNQNEVNWSMVSRFTNVGPIGSIKQAQKLSGTTTLSTTNATIGAVFKSGGNINFIGGTIAYFLEYNRALTQGEIQQAYGYMAAQVYSRPVFLHPYPTFPLYTNPVWQRQGVVLLAKPNGTTTCTEPDVIYDTNPQVLTQFTNVFKMMCSADGGTTGTYYYESADGLSWTAGGLATNGLIRVSFLKVNGIYHLFGEAGAVFAHYSSSNGLTGWTLSASNILTVGGVGTWDHTAINNPHVTYDATGVVGPAGTWYMTYEGLPGTNSQPGEIGGATATDQAGNVWTKTTANPITGTPGDPYPEPTCYGAASYIVNAAWYLWCGNFAALKRFYSPTFNDLWIWNQVHASIVGTAYNETNQIGDPSLVQGPCPSAVGSGTCTFIYYWPSGQNGQATGINLAIANMPISALVLTNEGATTDWP